MQTIVITLSLRLELIAALKREMETFADDKWECYGTYPTLHILHRLDLACLRSFSAFVSTFASSRQDELISGLLLPGAVDLVERKAWNEHNALLLLSKALERAWRLPMTRGDILRAMKRLCNECQDQQLLEHVQSGALHELSEEELQRGRQLGIIIEGLWCPWMELLDFVNPMYLKDAECE